MQQSRTRVAVFTDIHFTTAQPENGIDPVERFVTGLRHAIRFVPDIDHVVITGDLTNRGDLPSYQLLRKTLEEHETPVHLMIGNHDNRENFLEVFPETPIDDNQFVQRILDTPHGRLVFLDTLDAPPYDYPRSHRGFMCDKRLAWFDTRLEEAGKQGCIVFMHHHPHPVGFRAMDTINLTNGDAFYAIAKKHGNVRHISCGHVHRTISGSHHGIPFSLFKSTVGQMPMTFESMNFQIETDEPPAYGIIDITEDSIIVHTEDFGLTDLAAIDR